MLVIRGAYIRGSLYLDGLYSRFYGMLKNDLTRNVPYWTSTVFQRDR